MCIRDRYLGERYINAGQNTMYLQRFNVKSNGTYSIYTHQYMTNISGAASEAASTADAYQSLGIAAHAKTFVIPVFNNMPSESNTIKMCIRDRHMTAVSDCRLLWHSNLLCHQSLPCKFLLYP